jgi:Zinc-finger of C2H2 type
MSSWLSDAYAKRWAGTPPPPAGLVPVDEHLGPSPTIGSTRPAMVASPQKRVAVAPSETPRPIPLSVVLERINDLERREEEELYGADAATGSCSGHTGIDSGSGASHEHNVAKHCSSGDVLPNPAATHQHQHQSLSGLPSPLQHRSADARAEPRAVWQCDVCSISLCGEVPFRQHMNGAKHRRKVALSGIADVLGVLKCKFCDVECISREHLRVHMANDCQGRAIADQDSGGNSMDIIEPVQSDEGGPSPLSEALQKDLDNTEAGIFACSVCNVGMSGPEAFVSHKAGKAHAKAVALFANPVDLTHVPWCDVCKISCNTQAVLNVHLASAKHARRVVLSQGATINSNYFCNACNIACAGPESYDSHLAGQSHAKTITRSCMTFGPPL